VRPTLQRLAVAVTLAATVGLAGCGSTDVTRARLEASIVPTFDNL